MAESFDPLTAADGDTSRPVGHRGIGPSLAAIGAALLASLCCIGPVLFVTVGVGAGLARQFEPLRPVLTILTVGLMAAGFYSVYGRRDAKAGDAPCDADGVCRVPRNRTRDKVVLWTAALIALVLLTFPQWSLWVF
ncbi:MAG: mercuric transporter MerT family protein [Gemmatimonadaceae bacterium]|nr:mercuric transporter MerT family protein [Gemmatimonadaceae bacterium]